MAAMGSNMRVTCKTSEVLKKVRVNREKHSKIVNEAREGYVEKAKTALAEKMEKLKEGKIVQLYFSLQVPEDHTKEYDTVIKMLEMHQNETIELTANEVSNFIEDDWGWKDHFLRNNAVYSQTATELCED